MLIIKYSFTMKIILWHQSVESQLAIIFMSMDLWMQQGSCRACRERCFPQKWAFASARWRGAACGRVFVEDCCVQARLHSFPVRPPTCSSLVLSVSLCVMLPFSTWAGRPPCLGPLRKRLGPVGYPVLASGVCSPRWCSPDLFIPREYH